MEPVLSNELVGMASSGEVLVINDVVSNGEIAVGAEKSPSTPFLRQLVQNAVGRWKSRHEAAINKRIVKMKVEKRKRLEEMAGLMPESRRTPLDMLAREWMDESGLRIDTRVYLIEKLLPTLIMGLERLLNEAEKLQLIDDERQSGKFNPLNYLAQYLMRNNPLYSNFPEASAYAKEMRRIAEDVRCEMLQMNNNKLAKIKADAQRRKLKREKMDQMREEERETRDMAIKTLYVKWSMGGNKIPLAGVSEKV